MQQGAGWKVSDASSTMCLGKVSKAWFGCNLLEDHGLNGSEAEQVSDDSMNAWTLCQGLGGERKLALIPAAPSCHLATATAQSSSSLISDADWIS